MAGSIQDTYPDEVAVCYGCGRNNSHGLHVQTHWDGEEGICHFTPEAYHTAFPGYVYGGLIASLIDCHSLGTAIAALYQSEGRNPDTDPEITTVTGNLNVSYLKPTPIGVDLVIKARIKAISGRKVTVTSSVYANDVETARGEVIAIRVSSRMIDGSDS
ncbi:MAG: PaaI family thioesterase [Aggregatilineales bacterium]